MSALLHWRIKGADKPSENLTHRRHSSQHCLCTKRGSCQTLAHLHGCNIHNLEALQVDGAILFHVAPQLVQDGQHGDVGLACSRGGAQQDVVRSKQGSVANLQEPRAAVRRELDVNRHVDCPARALLALSSAGLQSLPSRELVHVSQLHNSTQQSVKLPVGRQLTYSRQAAVLCWEVCSHQDCALLMSECVRHHVGPTVCCAFWSEGRVPGHKMLPVGPPFSGFCGGCPHPRKQPPCLNRHGQYLTLLWILLRVSMPAKPFCAQSGRSLMAFSFSPSAKGLGARAGTCTSSYPCRCSVQVTQQQLSGTQSQLPEAPGCEAVHLLKGLYMVATPSSSKWQQGPAVVPGWQAWLQAKHVDGAD